MEETSTNEDFDSDIEIAVEAENDAISKYNHSLITESSLFLMPELQNSLQEPEISNFENSEANNKFHEELTVALESIVELKETVAKLIGMVSIVTIFGHKHFNQKIQNLIFFNFHEQHTQWRSILVHIRNQNSFKNV